MQLSFNDATDREIFAKAQSVRSEYVLAATGTLQKRESVNKELKTGEIELAVTDLRVLSKAQTPPFEIANADKVGDETTLKYRYLHLRNERLTQNLLMRHKIAKIAQGQYFYGHDFVEIETPRLSNPPRRAPGTMWCRPGYTRASSMPCPKAPRSTNSCA